MRKLPVGFTFLALIAALAMLAPVALAAEADDYLPLAEIAAATPQAVTYEFSQPNFGWSIDAPVILPETLDRFDIVSCALGPEMALEAVLDALATPEERARMTFEDGEGMDFLSMKPSMTKWALIQPDPMKGPDFSAVSVPGSLSYSRSFPDEYANPREDLDFPDRGVLSPDGVARPGELTAQGAWEAADAFLSKLPLPFSYRAGEIAAFSATDDTAYTRGFYRVYVEQLIDGKPVAVLNQTFGHTWGAPEDPTEAHTWVGSVLYIFDLGVVNADLRWLDEAFEVVEPVEKLITLDAAIAAVEARLAEVRPNVDAASLEIARGGKITAIRLEYAGLRREDGRLVLTPCWNFEVLQQPELFSGIRVNAVTGELVAPVEQAA